MTLSAGAAIEQVIRDDLGEHVELDPREEALLAAAAAQPTMSALSRPTFALAGRPR